MFLYTLFCAKVAHLWRATKKSFTRLLLAAAQVLAFYRLVDLAVYMVLVCCDYSGHILLLLLGKAEIVDDGEGFSR